MNLYRRRTFPASLVVLLAFAFLTISAFAQRRKPHKLRATGLLTLTTDAGGTTTARLTPITILDQGRFEDASIYKASPEPMALDKGVVYEAEKSGVPAGYVTILSSSNQGIWTALGKWQPVTEEAKKTEQPAPPPNSSNSGDDRPILHRGGDESAGSFGTEHHVRRMERSFFSVGCEAPGESPRQASPMPLARLVRRHLHGPIRNSDPRRVQ